MKKMKRMLSVLFALALMLGLTACSSAAAENKENTR